ncbi:MAG: CDP-alcohol phosphatidyltransferase family protein [Pseudomonadota bacterium]
MTTGSAEANYLHARSTDGFITKHEKQFLISIAERLPHWATPDHLTLTGVIGSFIVFVSLIGSHFEPLLLLCAVGGLVLNWFGDSLDGTLARVRRIERRRYGFYLDHVSDLASQFMIIVGLGLSPLMRLEFALLGLVGYLALSVMSFVKLHVSRDLQICYFGVGPTEIRLIICAGLVVPLLSTLPVVSFAAADFTLFDIGAGLAFTFCVVTAVLVFYSELKRLAVIDPSPQTIPPEQEMRELEPFEVSHR